MNQFKYDFLDRTVITIHKEQEAQVSKDAFDELKRFEHIQFYNREKMMQISKEGRIQEAVNRLVEQILTERRLHPDGSNTECIAMDMFTEFISKLDLEDFRRLRIERLADGTNVD